MKSAFTRMGVTPEVVNRKEMSDMGWVENYGKGIAVAIWLPRHARICSLRMK